MVTYPSTHGVFEDTIADICASVHDAGGQVYVDGANLNALVGLARPGRFGADVSHLNLHKTFCIPHGGGGPGRRSGGGARAPRAVPAEPPARRRGRPGDRPGSDQRGAVRQRRHPADQLGVRPAHGRRGPDPRHPGRGADRQLRRARGCSRTSRCSTPAAAGWSPTSASSTCAPITKETGVTVDDVAKRLIDYGFHAPTMSFPVAGTLMIEPTESEDLAELDRFCDAMIAIRKEIDEVAAGTWPKDDNPLRGAPHTASCVTGEWDAAVLPRARGLPGRRLARPAKYWPPVRRIDGAYGDRNLVCSCPSPEAYEELRGSAGVPDARQRRAVRGDGPAVGEQLAGVLEERRRRCRAGSSPARGGWTPRGRRRGRARRRWDRRGRGGRSAHRVLQGQEWPEHSSSCIGRSVSWTRSGGRGRRVIARTGAVSAGDTTRMGWPAHGGRPLGVARGRPG